MRANHRLLLGLTLPTPPPFDAHDTRGMPPLNELKAAYDLPLPHEDLDMDEERRLLSVAQCCRDWIEAQEEKARADLLRGWGPEGLSP